MANAYYDLYSISGDQSDLNAAKEVIDSTLPQFAQFVRYAASLSPSMLSRLTGLDNYNLHGFSGLTGLKTKIALREAAAGLPEEEKDTAIMLLDSISPDWITFYLGRWLYILGYNEQDINTIAQHGSGDVARMAMAAAHLQALHKATGIGQTQIADEIMATYGLNPDDAARVYEVRIR